MKKNINTLDAITTLDGRYRDKVEKISEYVSEKALIKVRFEVEIRYLIALSEAGIIRTFSDDEKKKLETFIESFSDNDAARAKEIEETTRHDVKAVEYLIREKLENTQLSDISEKTHLFLTSEDINNISQRLLLTRALHHEVVPQIGRLIHKIAQKAQEYADVSMIARTHGQSAVPTTVGKELVVFADRMDKALDLLKKVQITGKLSGAVGNYNSFRITSDKPYEDWVKFSENFVKQFGFTNNPVTTQINTPEDMIEVLQILQRINGIGIDFASDCWRYISDNWFTQEKVAGEVGSSTMPQKINPIDFENGEGNLHLANDVIKGLVDRLPASRLQRDLRDSTQLRNMGLVLGFITLGFSSIEKGFEKIEVNIDSVKHALDADWSILSEGAQVWLRANTDIADPYALFKDITRGKRLNEAEWQEAVGKLDVSSEAKKVFVSMTPENYVGFAQQIADKTAKKLLEKYKI